MAVEKKSVSTKDGPMTVHIATPKNKTGPSPALIVMQEAFGVNSHIIHVCEKLAEHGYVALAPEMFHRSGEGLTIDYTNFAAVKPILGVLTNDMMIEDIAATYKLAQTMSSVDPNKIGTIGFCMGGFAAVLGACHINLQSAISYYGGGMTEERPGFAFKPFASEFSHIKCPVLMGFGAEDHSIPGAQVELIQKQFKAVGVKADFIVYPEASHGFLCDERSAYHPKMAEKAWKDIFNWLKHCGTMSL